MKVDSEYIGNVLFYFLFFCYKVSGKIPLVDGSAPFLTLEGCVDLRACTPSPSLL